MAIQDLRNESPYIRLGLIGPGAHAQEQLLPALTQIPGCRLEAVAASSISSARSAAQRWQAPRYTDDWTDLVNGDAVDAVIVAASPQLHADVLARCLASGVHVFVEKPPAPSSEMLRELVSQEKSAVPGTIAFVGFNFPYGESYAKLRQAMSNRGDLRSLEVKMVSHKPTTTQWGAPTVLNSLLQGLGTHAVDLALREMGTPESVQAVLSPLTDNRFLVRIQLMYSDGSIATLQVGNYANTFHYRCEMITSECCVGVLDQHNVLSVSGPPSRGANSILDPREFVRFDWPSRRGGYGRTGYSSELSSFFNSIRNNVPSTSSLTAALSVYEVLDEVSFQLEGQVPVG